MLVLADCMMIVYADLGDLTIQCEGMNHSFMHKIKKYEVKEVLKMMKSREVIALDGIPIEVWKYLGEIGLRWLINLFNKI